MWKTPGGARAPDHPEDARALAAAERKGLRIALTGRTIALCILCVASAHAFRVFGNPAGLSLALGLLALGVVHHLSLGTRWERRWHRYAFFAIDIAAIAYVAATATLWSGGEVPQILVFQLYGAHFLFFALAVAALTLSPGLVVFTGAGLVVALWAVYAVAVAELPAPLSWRDLPPGADAQRFFSVVLSPSFVGTGNRVSESVSILLTALVLAAAVARARRVVRERAAAERGLRQAEELFGRYVPPEVARELMADPDALAPQTREASILFLDIAGFTRIATGRPPAQVVGLLDSFFARATSIISAQGGVVVGFVGDGLVASFGLPRRVGDHAGAAIAAARELNAAARRGDFHDVRLAVRIGVASGPVAAGSVGGARRTYTVYGEPVNVAQRLEEANKQHASDVMVAESTWRAAGAPAGFRPLGAIALRGHPEPLTAVALESADGSRAAAAVEPSRV